MTNFMFGRLKEFFNQPTNSAAFTTINLLLGAGPIIIPEPFFRAGFLFSTVITLIIFLISYNSANYIGQAIKKIGDHKQIQTALPGVQEENRQSMISTDHNQDAGLLETTPTIKTFGHAEQFGYLYGQKWKIFPVLSISIYLFGVAISKCIMTGNILSKLLQDVPVLNSFYFWLSIFFVAGAAFSFKSIQKTKGMQAVLIVVRFVSIALMIIGAIIIMFQNEGIQNFTPKDGNFVFNIQFFGNIFSNLIFSFMFHHSLPGITEQLTKISQIKDFVKASFIIAGSTMLSIPITAVMAFGNDLVQKRTALQDGGGGLIYYNEDFQGRLDFIYYIVSFYVFLNVAAFSIYVIVIRKNILSLLKPNVSPDVVSKTTITFTAILLFLILAISFALKNQIQVALNFTGGIFGCIILFAIPCMQVFKARKLFPPEKSFLNSYVWMPVALMVLGALCMIFNLYETIKKLVE